MSHMRLFSMILLLIILVGCTTKPTVNSSGSAPDPTQIISNSIISRDIGFTGSIEGFKQAVKPYQIELPRDLGIHPEYKVEWWYYSGSLNDATGNKYGYQFTIFRQALVPPRTPVPGQSAWRTTEGYLGDFAITDASGKVYRHAYRSARGGEIGLAGAQANPYRVWVENWSASGNEQTMKLQANDDDVKIGIDLQLSSTKPFVAQDDNGLSQKGDNPGESTYYFSLTRMQTSGRLMIDGKSIPVTGSSWMDREWGTNTLLGKIGWDWFALQSNNNKEIMWYQIRYPDGSIGKHSQGSFIDRDNGKTRLSLEDIHIDVLEHWISKETDTIYPSRWKITIPKLDVNIDVRPIYPDQELTSNHVYWEGSVEFSGKIQGVDVIGRGYVEMTGYITEQRFKNAK